MDRIRAFFSHSIRNKLIVSTLLVTIAGIFIVTTYAMVVTALALRENAQRQELTRLETVGGRIVDHLALLERDIEFLQTTPGLQAYLGNQTSTARDNAVAQFLAFANASDNYDSIQVLDANGQELIDISLDQSGIWASVADDDLQNQRSQYYFEAAMNLTPDEVFISPLDLKVVDNRLAQLPDGRYLPVIRYAAPLAVGGEIVGVLVTTALGQPIIDLVSTGGEGIYLLDEDGYFLYHPDIDLTWGRQRGNDITVFTELPPTLTRQFLSNEANYANDAGNFVAYTPLPRVNQTMPLWYLGTLKSYAQILEPVTGLMYGVLAVSLIVMVMAVVLSVLIDRTIIAPIVRLSTGAAKIAVGDYNVNIPVDSQDEIGQLAASFNTMSKRVQRDVMVLESRVANRTQRLEVVVSIGQQLANIYDLDELLKSVVSVTKETFNYYHVHIYLFNKDKTVLEMVEGYGKAGLEMKRRGHYIPAEAVQSLVARAARHGYSVVIEDVQEDPTWLSNPLLPDTRSEIAVPIKLGDEVVGVLDVQSEKVAGLTQDEQSTLEALANEIASAVRNARFVTENKQALAEAQRLQKQYTTDAWYRFNQAREATTLEVRTEHAVPIEEIGTPEIIAAIQSGQRVTMRLPRTAKNLTNPLDLERPPQQDLERTVALPLQVSGFTIGALGIRSGSEQDWSYDEIALIEAVAAQMSQALDNARLFEQTQRSARRDRLVSDATARVWQTPEIEAVMKTAVAELGQQLGASEVVIQLGRGDEVFT